MRSCGPPAWTRLERPNVRLLRRLGVLESVAATVDDCSMVNSAIRMPEAG